MFASALMESNKIVSDNGDSVCELQGNSRISFVPAQLCPRRESSGFLNSKTEFLPYTEYLRNNS